MLKFAACAALVVSAAAVAAEKSGDGREKLICKRETKTGSLVAPKRTCLSAEQWKLAEMVNKQNNKGWSDAIDGARSNQ